MLGAKFKVVPGYPGSAEVLLAMERGETEGFCSMGFVTLEYTRPDWVRDKKVNQLVQLGLTKNKNHLDVPLALDLAKTEADKQAIEFVVSPNLFARPFMAPPGVPAERVAALRQAFNATLDDPDYLRRGRAAEDAGAAGARARRSTTCSSASSACRGRSWTASRTPSSEACQAGLRDGRNRQRNRARLLNNITRGRNGL